MTQLVLPADVLLVPVADLAEDVRSRFDWDPGDVAITRARSRVPSRVVDARAAALLERFRRPTTIVDAVLAYSEATDADAESTLEEAFPLLDRLVRSAVLVSPDDDAAAGVVASLAPGDDVAGHTVLRAVRLMDDVEVYQVRDAREAGGAFGALKLARAADRPDLRDALAREAAVLDRLGGAPAPRLVAHGETDGRAYLVAEWCAGVDAATAAQELRALPEPEARAALLDLCHAIAAAYAALHARGVLHADVHPGNVLVDARGTVRLVDFGLSWTADDAADTGPARGAVPFYYDPEHAAALLADRAPPAPTAAGEQYALAATLYLLAAGAHAREYSLERTALLRQVTSAPVRAFAEAGAAPWPELERVLRRALDPSPAARFPSVAALAYELDALRRAGPSPASSLTERLPPLGPAARALVADVTDRARREAEAPATLGVTAPTGSVTYGAAGVAYYLHRVAALRGDPDLLARADLWATRAAARADDASWYSEALGITAPVVGPNGLHHSIAGAHCVRALVLSAMGDARGAAEAALDFVAASAEPTEFTDVTLGRAGTLLGCALLVEASGGPDAAGSAPLVAFGDGIERGVRAALARSPAEVPSPSLASAPEAGYAGIAHGEGGLLYALLRWAAAVGRAPDAALDDRLAALAGRGVPLGRGVAWWWRTGGEAAGEEAGLLPGWCNGSAGFVHLWTLAHRAFGRDAYARAAEGAAWHAWEDAARPVDLCCGLAGRAYALLALHEHAGDVRWLQRAVRLANAAAEGARHAPLVRGSLYKGEVGVALLCAELEGSAPVRACMPMFGSEGWGWERPAAAPRPLGR